MDSPSTSENEATVIKPAGSSTVPRAPVLRATALRPGRPREAAQAAAPTVLGRWDRGLLDRAGVPPLAAAALPLLNLVGRLRLLSEQPDLEVLRGRVIQSFRTFEQKALGAGVPPERVRAAHYALCATVDDVVLNAPWGAYSMWARQGMVTTFHGDVTGGERFFDLLAHSHKDPGTNRDVLLLMYFCLSIGFEGRMRVHQQGHLELGRIREGLYRTLRGDVERELSPQWRGADMRHRPLSTPIVLWTGAIVALLAVLATYFSLAAALDRRSDTTLAVLLQAPPSGVPTLARAAKPTAQPSAPPTESSGSKLRVVLASEIQSGMCEVQDSDGGSRVRLKNEGLFDVGRADIKPRFAEMLDRLGRSLQGTAGTLVVVGHTDNTPIRTSRFPSNYYLSVARAESVSKVLGTYFDVSKIRAEGRGAAEPIADNATPLGREQNRRTDILVLDRQG